MQNSAAVRKECAETYIHGGAQQSGEETAFKTKCATGHFLDLMRKDVADDDTVYCGVASRRLIVEKSMCDE